MERKEGGFTLVELLVVSVLAMVVLGAIYQTLTVQQRTYERQGTVIETNAASRTTVEVLAAELREVSSSGSDLLEAAEEEVTIRAMRKFGLACHVPAASDMLDVWTLGDAFDSGDRLLVFDQGGNPDDASDDGWLELEVDEVSSGYNSAACGDWPETSLRGSEVGPFPRQRLVISGGTLATVGRGGPVRSYETLRYGIYEFDGIWMLGRSTDGNDPVPLVGPLASPEEAGLRFTYYDGDGNEIAAGQLATSLQGVRSFRVAVRAEGQTRDLRGRITEVDDELGVAIFLRNNDPAAF